MQNCEILIEEIIKVLGQLMGTDLVVKRALQIGIKVDDYGKVMPDEYNEQTVDKLLQQFKALSGNLAINYLLSHMDHVFSTYPQFKEFLIKRKT